MLASKRAMSGARRSGVPDAPIGAGPRLIVLLMSSGVIVVGALDVLFVATAIEPLDIGASGAAFLSAAFGAGAIVGAASTVALVGRRRLTPSLAGGASLFGAPIGLVAIAPSAVSAPVLFAAAGAGTERRRRVRSHLVATDLAERRPLEGVRGPGRPHDARVGHRVRRAAILIEAYGVQAALVVVGAFLPVVILLGGTALVDRPIRRGARRRAPSPPARHPLFAPLPAPAMERVLADMFPIEVPDGAVLIREGDPGDLFYVIVEGRVEITRGGERVSSWDRARTSARSHCCATSRGRPR